MHWGAALTLHWLGYGVVFLVNCHISCCTICRIRLAAEVQAKARDMNNMKLPIELSFILWYLHAVTLPFLGECSLATGGYYAIAICLQHIQIQGESNVARCRDGEVRIQLPWSWWMTSWLVRLSQHTLLVPVLFSPVGFSMQLLDWGHHSYISPGFCRKHFYLLIYVVR